MFPALDLYLTHLAHLIMAGYDLDDLSDLSDLSVRRVKKWSMVYGLSTALSSLGEPANTAVPATC